MRSHKPYLNMLALKIQKLWCPSALKAIYVTCIITCIIVAGSTPAIGAIGRPSTINATGVSSTISAADDALVISASDGFSSASAAEGQPAGKAPAGIQSSQENSYLQKLSKIHNPGSSFSVKLWVAGQPKAINIGDKINFFFQTPRDCYLTLLDMATNGDITILFPNKFHPNNLVKAGKQYAIPGDYNFEMTISGPTGIEKVKAIATLQPARLFNINLSRGPFDSMPLNDDRAVRGVGGLKTKLEKQNWAETEISFEIRQNHKNH